MNRGRWRRAIAMVIGALALWRTPAARAQDVAAPPPAGAGQLALTWRAPAPCPASSDVEARFHHLVGTLDKHLEATAVVEPTASGGWTLDLSTVLEGAAGHRVLAGDSCAAVAEAAALILALMIDPAAAERAATPPPPAPPPPRPVIVVAPAPAPPRIALRPYVRAFAGPLFDALPETTGAAGLAAGLARGHVGAELSFLTSREAHATSAARADAGATFRLLAAGARGCARFGGAALLGQACLGGELSRITGRGTGVDRVTTDAVLVGAGTVSFTLVVPVVSRVSLTLDLAGAAHPYRPTFYLDGVGDLWRVPGLSAFAGLGLLVII